MSEFKLYERRSHIELRPYVHDENLDGVSISAPDKRSGSPKVGDWIARNPKDPKDLWLVSAAYFADNYYDEVESDNQTND
jgi:hypothetical protein